MDYTSNDTTSIEVNGHWISPFATRVEFGLNQPDTLRTNGRPQLFKPQRSHLDHLPIPNPPLDREAPS